MTNELAGFFMCLLGPFFEDACQLPNVILGSWEANLSPENTLISFPPGTVHVSFSFSKSSPNTQTRLRAAWADPLSPRGLIVRCSDPPEYPRPAGNLAGLQLQRFGHREPAGSSLLSACPRLRFGRGALISHASKVMLKILQVRLQQYMNRELPDVQAGFRKGRRTRDQIADIHWIIGKAREFQKKIYFFFIDYAKAFDCVDHNKLWKILQEMGIPDHLTCLLKNLYAG